MPETAEAVKAWRWARCDQQLRCLETLRLDGTDLAQRVRQQANAANWLGTEGPLIFSRLARSVRQTIALECRIEQRWLGGGRKSADDGFRPLDMDPAARPTLVNPTLGDAVFERAAEAAERDAAAQGPNDRENLLGDWYERLDDPDVEAELGNRPVAAVVVEICETLGVDPALHPFTDAEPNVASGRPDTNAGSPPEAAGAAPPPVRPLDAAVRAALGGNAPAAVDPSPLAASVAAVLREQRRQQGRGPP